MCKASFPLKKFYRIIVRSFLFFSEYRVDFFVNRGNSTKYHPLKGGADSLSGHSLVLRRNFFKCPMRMPSFTSNVWANDARFISVAGEFSFSEPLRIKRVIYRLTYVFLV